MTMTNNELAEVERLRLLLTALLLSPAQQYRLAFLIAENVGFALKSNDPLADLSKPGSVFSSAEGKSHD